MYLVTHLLRKTSTYQGNETLYKFDAYLNTLVAGHQQIQLK